MKDLRLFGTSQWMIHPSGIRPLLICPWREVLKFLEAPESDESGPAANTGSAMHFAAKLFHGGKDVADSLQGMRDNIASYPLASLPEAAQMFLSYATDPRNRDAKVLLCEEAIRFTIAPHESDPTQEGIEVIGTLDQVREDEYGRLKLYDIKTSKNPPEQTRLESFFQFAAYCVGATVKLGRPVDAGAIITPRFYEKNGNVFHQLNFKLADCEHILEPLRRRVAEIRRGDIYLMPTNDGCRWCHQRMPDICHPKLAEFHRSRIPLA